MHIVKKIKTNRAALQNKVARGTCVEAQGHAKGASIGQYVRDLELIAKACDPGEWQNTVMYPPL